MVLISQSRKNGWAMEYVWKQLHFRPIGNSPQELRSQIRDRIDHVSRWRNRWWRHNRVHTVHEGGWRILQWNGWTGGGGVWKDQFSSFRKGKVPRCSQLLHLLQIQSLFTSLKFCIFIKTSFFLTVAVLFLFWLSLVIISDWKLNKKSKKTSY